MKPLESLVRKTDFDPQNLLVWKEIDPEQWATIVQDVLQTFEVYSRDQMILFRESLRLKNADSISRYAHSLKSTFANVGGLEIHRLFEIIENSAKREEWDIVMAAVAGVEARMPSFQKGLTEFKIQMSQVQAA